MSIDKRRFSILLQKLIEEGGYKKSTLHEKIFEKTGKKINRESISKYLNQKATPSVETVQLFAEFFNVSVEYLVGDSKYPRCSDSIGDACVKADEELGEKGLADLRFQIELIKRFEESFGVTITDFTPKQQKQLDKEIREFIRFKLDSLRKEKGK